METIFIILKIFARYQINTNDENALLTTLLQGLKERAYSNQQSSFWWLAWLLLVIINGYYYYGPAFLQPIVSTGEQNRVPLGGP
jgi:hypothetical protein